MAHLLDEEMLETLTYERSRTWANFIKTCEENDYGEEVPLNKLEELHEDENEEDLDEIEEAEEDDVEDDIKNTTMTMSKAELTLMLTSGDNKEILNQTLPIVEEHVRKWKEAGLDRILNTFDPQKIEQHVGDWLRRNNSAYGDKTVVQSSQSKSCHKRHKTKSGVDIYSPIASDDSETESMHSVDTARYIRESRKCTVSSSSKCNSPMMTIKTYRTVPRMRAELRAKYELNEEKEHHHMQALIHRRDQRIRDHERQRRYHSIHYPYSHDLKLNGTHRRKHLRKRRDVSIIYSSSSSSEDDRRDSRCMCSPCLRRTISQTVHPYYAYRSYQSHSQSYRDYHHRRLESGSRSIHSTLSYKRSVCKLRRQHALDNDIRPRLSENECKCCNNDRLCSKVVHIANSSTEEWYVQNESSPDQMVQMPKTRFSPAIRCDFKSQDNHHKHIKEKQRCIDFHEGLSSSGEEEETTKQMKPVLDIKRNVSESRNKTSIPSVKFTDAENMSTKKQVRKQKQTPKSDPAEPIIRNESIPKLVPPNCLATMIEEQGKEPSQKKTSKAPKEKPITIKNKRLTKQEKIVDEIETAVHNCISKTVPPSCLPAVIEEGKEGTEKEEKIVDKTRTEKQNDHISTTVPSSCLPATIEEEGMEPVAVDVVKIKGDQKVLSQEKTLKTLRLNEKTITKKRNEKQKKNVDTTRTAKKNICISTTDPARCLPATIEEEGMEPSAVDEVKVKGDQNLLGQEKSLRTSTLKDKTITKKQNEKQKKIVDKTRTAKKNNCISTVDPPRCFPATIEEERMEPRAVDEVKVKGDQNLLGQEKSLRISTLKEKTVSKNRIVKQKKIVDKTPTTKNKRYKRISIKSDESDESDMELKEALEISRKTYIQEQEKIRQQDNTSNITIEASTSLQLPEKSSFSNQSVACNSTTVFSQTDKPRSQNPIQMVTIVELSPSDNSVSEQERTTNIHSKRDADCTLVTSTTGCEAVTQQPETTVGTQRSEFKITKNGILLYAPKQVATGKQAQLQHNYMLTEQSLSPIIGERRARRFLKYHVGSRSFDSRYSVYYRPTAKVVAMLSGDSKSHDLDTSSSSGSDVDIFEQVDRYGVVYTVLEKHNDGD